MHLIIYGPEGSGKGTQAKHLSEKYGLPIITSGDLVRQTAATERGKLGTDCRQALSTGKYVSDETMFVLWKNKLTEPSAAKGFILDGFPRNLAQSKFLIDTSGSCGYEIDKFIYIKISNDEAYKRLIKRNRKLFEGSSVSHDTPERIALRLNTYRREEKKVLDYFRKTGKLLEIPGEKSVEEVFQSIVDSLS